MPNRDKKRVCAYLTAEEYEQVKEKSKRTALSMSSYTRSLLTGYEPRSIFDQDAVLEMIRAKADLGRLGGLLKLAITEGKEKARVRDMRQLLEDIRKGQGRLDQCCRQVVESYKKRR